jgi:hypothetical protein
MNDAFRVRGIERIGYMYGVPDGIVDRRRYGAAGAGVTRTIYLAHAAHADRGKDFVWTEPGAESQFHGALSLVASLYVIEA